MHVLKLNSPYDDEKAVFNLQPNVRVPDESNEIIQTIKYLSEDYSEDLKPILNDYLNIPNRFDKYYENLNELCENYNKWTLEYKKLNENESNKKKKTDCRPSSNLARFIMQLIYNRSVLEPDKLNHYEPFSPQVYGETSFDLIDQMLKKVKLKENDVFVDLGSGVGNVVLHVAAVTKCKRCYGFEKAEWPAFYANKMEKEFKFWMNFFGKAYSDFELHKADFLTQEEYLEVESDSNSNKKRKITMGDYVKEVIDQSTLIFVNNYAFGAEVDHQLKLRFLDMLEGSIIVSSKPFCPLNFRINDRNLNDIGAILNLNDIEPLNGKVSWTDKPVNYYFQKIDRTLLEKYYESKKNPSKIIKEENHNQSDLSKSKMASSHSPRSVTSASSTSSSNKSANSSSPSSPLSDLNESINSKIKLKHKNCSNSKENKKRKSTNEQSISSSSLKAKKIKLKEKNKLELLNINKKSNKHRSKSLDKEEKKTLEQMHLHASKLTKASHNNSSKTNNTGSNNSNDSSNSFNQKTLTKLNNDNLDNKLLKDTKISQKFSKHLNLNCINNKHQLNEIELNDDLDESDARKELGDEIINSIDNYFKKCRKQYIKYLLFMKSPEYKEKVNLQYQKETSLKNELLIKKEQLENQKKSLLKTNISLLKQRAEELGIKDLKSPTQLIQYAKEILSEHRELEQKINSILETINLSHTSGSLSNNQKSRLLSVNFIQNSDEKEKESSLLNKLLSTIDASNETSANKQDKSSSNSSEKQDEASNSNKTSNQIADLKSVSSNHSNEETLTATERGDDEEEDLNINDDNDKNDKNGGSNANTEHDNNNQNENDSNSSKKDSKQNSKTQNNINSNSSNNSTCSNSKSLMDKLLLKDSNDSLKNFKIPKQSNKKEPNQVESTDKSISPGLYSPSSSSTRSPVSSAFETNISKNNKNLNRNLSCESPISNSANLHINEYSSSSCSSPLLNSNQTDSNKTTSNYYHPKKNQFRQYMMENSNESKFSPGHSYSNLNNSNSDGYFNRHHHPHDEYSNYTHSRSTFNLNNSVKNKNNYFDFDSYRNTNNIISSSSSYSSSSGSNNWNYPNNNSQSDYNQAYHYGPNLLGPSLNEHTSYSFKK